MSKILITSMIQQLENILDGDLWIDENFTKKIDKLPAEKALTKPSLQIFSVAELISHLTAWRRQQMKKLDGSPQEVIEKYPDYWRSNSELKKIKWSKLKNEFYQSQQELICLLKKKDDTFLKQEYSDSGNTYEYIIQGLIHHDIYHLGQIGITIKLLEKKV